MKMMINTLMIWAKNDFEIILIVFIYFNSRAIVTIDAKKNKNLPPKKHNLVLRIKHYFFH